MNKYNFNVYLESGGCINLDCDSVNTDKDTGHIKFINILPGTMCTMYTEDIVAEFNFNNIVGYQFIKKNED